MHARMHASKDPPHQKIPKYIEYLTQVPITTIMPDLAKKEAIKMVGAKTMRAAMEKGSEGRIVARFADGSVETLDISNLALEASVWWRLIQLALTRMCRVCRVDVRAYRVRGRRPPH